MQQSETSCIGKKGHRNFLGWEAHQESAIMLYYKEYGPNWRKISEKLGNRSPNTIKNKVNCSQKKLVNRLNTLLKGHKKSVQIYAINKFLFLTSPEFKTEFTREEQNRYEELRDLIIESSFKQAHQIDEATSFFIYQHLKEFNISFRHTNARKVLFMAKQKGKKIASKQASRQKTKVFAKSQVKVEEEEQEDSQRKDEAENNILTAKNTIANLKIEQNPQPMFYFWPYPVIFDHYLGTGMPPLGIHSEEVVKLQEGRKTTSKFSHS